VDVVSPRVPPQNPAFADPLREGDTLEQTIGCRHSKPQMCGKALLTNVCAYVRKDGACLAPPRSWERLYSRLLAELDDDSSSEASAADGPSGDR